MNFTPKRAGAPHVPRAAGGAFAYAGLGAVVEAARELRERGTHGYWERVRTGLDAVRGAFG